MGIRTLEFIPGHIVITDDAGQRVRQPIGDILRALDIPANLTINSLTLLTDLAQVVIILLRTLQDKEIINDEFTGDFSLEYLLEKLVDDMLAEDVPQ